MNREKQCWYVVKASYGYKGKSYECKCLNLTNHATGETRQYYFIQFLPPMRRKGYGVVERLLLFEKISLSGALEITAYLRGVFKINFAD